MIFIISKILGVLISPILWVFLFLFISFFSKKKRTLIFIASFILYFFTSPIIFNVFSRFVEEKQSKISETEKYEYGIILGGIAGVDDSGELIRFSENASRLLSTIELYNEGKISKILISAGSLDTSDIDKIEAILLKKYLVKTGIPKNRILTEHKSLNTRQNALFSAQILKPRKNEASYLLITSSYHLKRAKACFEKVGFEIDGFSSDRLGDIPKFTISRFIPSGNIIYKWHYILHEIIGLFAYKLMGYIE